MEHTAKPEILIVFLFVTVFSHTWLVYSRSPESLPSPVPNHFRASIGAATDIKSLNPYRGRQENPMRRSFPVTCHSKCNQCRPCVPVEVSIRTMALTVEENEYYPTVWKCMCQSNLFSP